MNFKYARKKLALAVVSAGLLLPVYSHAASIKIAATGKEQLPDNSATANSYGTIGYQANADLEKIRTRIIADLMAPAINEAVISELIKSIKPDGSWPNINYQDVSRTGFQHSEHLQNMLELSRAYKKTGSKFYGNPEAKKAASSALDFWLKHDFICDNWWWNEMGTPNHMINILLVLDTDLTLAQREKGLKIANRASLEAFGARPGGDLIQIAGMLGKQALFSRDEQVLARVVQVMADEIKVTTGRGLKPDLSFHHRTDNVISTLSYGTGYASSFAYWAVKIAGTQFTLPESAMKLLVDYFLDGICQSMVYGKYPDAGAKNRELSRKDALSPASAELAQNLVLASNYRREELNNIIKIRQGEKEPDLARTHFFWHSEYFTHQRPNYFASVRMHSSRGNNMEEPHNEEGLKNHHFGDGSNFIYCTGQEYFNIFPVWDWQKVPGTTVVQKPTLPPWKQIAKKGKSSFVGGVTDGHLGTAAIDLTSVHDPLKARKAWFFFQDAYVCLGTGITANTEYPVATTLNQSLLNQQVIIKRDKEEILPSGEHNLDKVAWVAHDNIAYIFLAPTALHLKNNTATGNWHEINHHTWATTDEVKKEVFKLWLDHGAKPQNAGYAYIVVPNLAAAQVEAYRKKNNLQILANTPAVQAVHHKKANISQVVFYQPGSIKLTKELTLTAQNPCMVMLQTGKNGIEKLTVSDPSRQLQTLELNITGRFEGTGNNWQATWKGKQAGTLVQVKLPIGDMAGESVVLEQKSK